MVNPDDPDYDIYRDSLLRYAGYANEVGEAFRAQESDKFWTHSNRLNGHFEDPFQLLEGLEFYTFH